MFKFFSKWNITSRAARINMAFGILVLGLIGLFDDTLLNETLMKIAVIVAILLWLASFYFVLQPMLRNYDQNTPIGTKRRRRRRLQIILGFAVIVPFFLYLAIGRGLPILGHYLLSSHGEMSVTIKSKADFYYRKHCRGGLSVLEYRYLFNNRVCLSDQSHWERIRPGDEVILSGRKSLIGFSYCRF